MLDLCIHRKQVTEAFSTLIYFNRHISSSIETWALEPGVPPEREGAGCFKRGKSYSLPCLPRYKYLPWHGTGDTVQALMRRSLQIALQRHHPPTSSDHGWMKYLKFDSMGRILVLGNNTGRVYLVAEFCQSIKIQDVP